MGREKAAAVIVVILIAAVALYFLTKGGEPSEDPESEREIIAEALSAGRPVECALSMDADEVYEVPELQGVDVEATIKVEAPKMRMEGSTMGFDFTMVFNGRSLYVNLPALGGAWYGQTLNDTAQFSSPDRIVEMWGRLKEGITMDCREVDDIPETEFRLPPGAVIKNMSELVGMADFSIFQP